MEFFRGLLLSEPHPCPYIEGQSQQLAFFKRRSLSTAVYQKLLEQGFRRSGEAFYRPIRHFDKDYAPVRVLASSFCLSKSLRRLARKNQDLEIRTHAPVYDDEHRSLFFHYQQSCHKEGKMLLSDDEYQEAYVNSPVHTIELGYYLNNRLIGVSILDQLPNALSSVYFYYDPTESKRGLGNFSVCHEVELSKELGLAHYYLGYYIKSSAKMNYKARFQPCELFLENSGWCVGEISQKKEV